jgi:prepilin-type N-terminal cleavage/methylation domain-containing protein
VKNKKGFTLIEVTLGLMIAAAASMYAIKTMQNNRFNSAIVELQRTVKYIIEAGIISSNGYASGSGGNCSVDLDFKLLDSDRLLQCVDWKDKRFSLDGDDNIIGRGLMDNYGACLVDVAVDSTNNRRFDVFVDCSNVNFNNKSVALIEDSIQFIFENDLSSIYVQTFSDATAVDTDTGGDATDGMIKAKFEL